MAHLRPAPGHRQVLTVTVVRVSTYQSPDAWMRAQSRPHQADAEVAGDEHPLHLADALADRQDLGVAVEPAGPVTARKPSRTVAVTHRARNSPARSVHARIRAETRQKNQVAERAGG
jgi:hypothetical protein